MKFVSRYGGVLPQFGKPNRGKNIRKAEFLIFFSTISGKVKIFNNCSNIKTFINLEILESKLSDNSCPEPDTQSHGLFIGAY